MTGQQIARRLHMAPSTTAAILSRAGVSRLRGLEPREPIVGYERQRAGELLHLDIKKLGRIEKVGDRITGDRHVRSRGAGWEYAHVAIDAASCVSARLRGSACQGTGRHDGRIPSPSTDFFKINGIRRIERVMTDNGSAYLSHLFAALCQQRNLRHLRTRPFRPQTNGKGRLSPQCDLRLNAPGFHT